jgi:hypothetical protein
MRHFRISIFLLVLLVAACGGGGSGGGSPSSVDFDGSPLPVIGSGEPWPDNADLSGRTRGASMGALEV